MNKITVGDVPWKVRWMNKVGPTGLYRGMCWPSEHVIEIDKTQEPIDIMNTLIHEMIHAEFPELCEEDVLQVADDLSRALEALGVRVEEKEKKAHGNRRGGHTDGR